MTLKFVGGPELIKAMEGLTARVSKNVLRDALETAAEPMRRDISRKAPHEPGAPDLRANIVIGKARDKGAVAVAVGPAQGYFYGFYQEYGTVHHGAQPFMRPAFDSGAARFIRDMAAAMWTNLASRGISQTVDSSTPVKSSGSLL